MKAKRRIRSLSLVSILVLVATVVVPVSPAFAAITWNTKAPMPTARTQAGAGAVNDKIYVIGGFGGGFVRATVEEYVPTTNTWSVKAPMPTARYGLAAAVVNNKIYAIGGFDDTNFFATVEEYDPTTNTWTTKAPMPTARDMLAAAVVNDKIYAISGNGGTGQEVEEYDPATNTWASKAPIPTPRWFPAAAVVNNKIYVIGGEWAPIGGPLTTVEEYDPATNAWTTKAPMPTGRSGLAATVVNSQIYAIGGTDGGPRPFATVEKYDPVTNSWSAETSMPTARLSVAAGVVNNNLYAIGGYDGNNISATNEEGIVPEDQETVQVQGTVDPTIELTLNPTTLSFGNVNPSVGSYSQTKTATVKSNKNWQLLVRKVTDLTGANTGATIPSNQLTYTSPAQPGGSEFLTTDTLVNSGGKTAGTDTTITYNFTVTWNDEPDSYSAEHIYTAIQP